MRGRFKLRSRALVAALTAIGLAAQSLASVDLACQEARWRHYSCGLGASYSNTNEPNHIQWVGNALFANGGSSNPTTIVVRHVDPCEQGDFSAILCQFGSSGDPISAIADDQGGTLANGAWVKGKLQPDAGNNQSVGILYRANCPAGLFKTTVTFSAQTAFIEFCPLKVNNIAPFSPLITSAGANPAATTTIAAGNMTTTVDDAFWIMVAACTSLGSPAGPARFTLPADTNDFTAELVCTVGPDFFSGACGMKRAQGTFNPTLTTNTAWAASAVAAIALKTAAGVGSRPIASYGGRVKFIQVINQATIVNSTGNFGTSHQYNVPCSKEVNGLAFCYDDPTSNFSGSPGPATRISDSNGNTWTGTARQLCGSGGGPWVGWVHSVGGTYSKAMTVTQTFTSAPGRGIGSMETIFFGLVGVGAFDTVQGFGANPNVAVPTTRNNVLPTDLAPSQRNAIILGVVQEDQETVSDITATNGGVVRLHMDDPGIYQLDEGTHDGGLMHMYHQGEPGTAYDFNISYVNYEGGLNLTNFGGQWIAFTCSQPRIAWDYTRFPVPLSSVRKVIQ
jgi:hypothetical protein